MQNNESKPAIVGVGAFMAASLGVALSASLDQDSNSLFVAESLDDTDVLAAEDEEEAKCGEGQCGEDDDDDDGDDEGECGEDEGGCGEGQCGEEDDADDDEDADEEDEEETSEE